MKTGREAEYGGVGEQKTAESSEIDPCSGRFHIGPAYFGHVDDVA